jgi:predicted TIM-barrel fold metal-dependent hydrolase
MGELTIVSSDSHATVPPDLWPEYLEKRFHEFLPRLRVENETWPSAMWVLSSHSMTYPGLETEHRSGGYRGVQDLGVRLAEMDREGIAAELVYHGDFRCSDMFHCTSNGAYPLEVWDAGVRAYHRWITDAFGDAGDRILRVGGIGPCTDMDATLAELDWIADHGFVATFAPGFVTHPDMPPLFDQSWERFWSLCEERGLALVVHAGFGFDHGAVYPEVERIYKFVKDSGGSELDLASKLTLEIFNGEFFSDLRPRRPMWQLMLGGVFDRHPQLKLLLTEVRADWIPATLRHLDAIYESNRADLPAKRKPSEYWHSNCQAGASFVHKAEVEMRHEIGVDTIAFGRDYPHPEGTWPHTKDWLRDAFAGVADDELRLMLGENAIRFLDLDRDSLDAIARRVGPTIDAIAGGTPDVDPALRANFDLRGGYLKPAEGGARVGEIDGMLREDLARSGVAVGAA